MIKQTVAALSAAFILSAVQAEEVEPYFPQECDLVARLIYRDTHTLSPAQMLEKTRVNTRIKEPYKSTMIRYWSWAVNQENMEPIKLAEYFWRECRNKEGVPSKMFENVKVESTPARRWL